jgi:hypothetical protein
MRDGRGGRTGAGVAGAGVARAVGPGPCRPAAGVRTAVLALLLAAGVAGAAAPAGAACRLALVLAMDVSASVDAREFRLQAQGTAAALMAPAVRGALVDGGAPVALAAFFWSGPGEVADALGWSIIGDEAALARFAARLAGQPRPGFAGRTAVGSAIAHAGRMLLSGPECDRRVLDIAGDGISNAGPAPAWARRQGIAPRITINALAIGGDLPLDHGSAVEEGGRLSSWFAAEVIQGPGAFVESAVDYTDVEAAMTRKLLRELAPLMVGALR